MAERFYINSPLAPGLVVLEGAEAHHLAVVCRTRPGDQVCLFNGDGNEYPSQVATVSKKAVELEVIRRVPADRERAFQLIIACPLPKGDRGQFLIEKLTELGCTAFIPLLTRYSVSLPSEAKTDKLERYIVEASKQCGRNRLMRIEPAVEIGRFLSDSALPPRRLLAHPGRAAIVSSNGDSVIALGPEGGWHADEVERAHSLGWQVVGLGPRILRIETAAIVAASLA